MELLYENDLNSAEQKKTHGFLGLDDNPNAWVIQKLGRKIKMNLSYKLAEVLVNYIDRTTVQQLPRKIIITAKMLWVHPLFQEREQLKTKTT